MLTETPTPDLLVPEEFEVRELKIAVKRFPRRKHATVVLPPELLRDAAFRDGAYRVMSGPRIEFIPTGLAVNMNRVRSAFWTVSRSFDDRMEEVDKEALLTVAEASYMDFDRRSAEEALEELAHQGEFIDHDGKVSWLTPDPAFLATQMDGRRLNEAGHLCWMLGERSDADRPMATEDLFEEARKQGVKDPEGAWKYVVSRMGGVIQEVRPNHFTTRRKAMRHPDEETSSGGPVG